MPQTGCCASVRIAGSLRFVRILDLTDHRVASNRGFDPKVLCDDPSTDQEARIYIVAVLATCDTFFVPCPFFPAFLRLCLARWLIKVDVSNSSRLVRFVMGGSGISHTKLFWNSLEFIISPTHFCVMHRHRSFISFLWLAVEASTIIVVP